MTFHHGTKAGFLDARCAAAILIAAWCLAGPMSQADAEAFAAAPAAGQAPGQPNPEQMKQIEAAKAAAAAGQPPGQPGQPGQPGAKPEEGKKPEGEKKDDASATVKRPDAPPKPPNPDDLKVALDKNGNVPPFNFIGQPWPDVMQWLANLSNSSLDWLEYPPGYLNLTTQHSYTVDEVHDLINQALNARGFTSIQSGVMLRVFKIEKVDPAAVQQVSEENLYNLKRYDFVKVSFELPADMEVDKAKDDVKQLLSPNAKVFPLVTTRRLLIMDSVANLRTVSEVFNQERMIKDGLIVPDQFHLKHARAEHVVEILKTMVGADQPARPQMTPEQMQQQQQMMQQMQQQGRTPPKMPSQADAPKVYFAVNRRQNSIIVNAPPAQLKIIRQTIKYLDVPQGDAAPLDDVAAERSLIKYNLVTMDPEQLKLTLEEIGELDPRTELRADTKSKILFAKATPADHKKIVALKDDLDGSGRTLRVFWLPRNMPAADAVAGTIMALMGGQEEKEDDNDGYPFYYYSYRSRSNDDDKPKKGFRVDADIENNRLLAWANDSEKEQIDQFLAELGKRSPASESRNTVRALDVSDPEATTRLLEQLRKAWPALGDNELLIDDKRPKTQTAPPEEKKPEAKPTAEVKDRAASANRAPADFPPVAAVSTRPQFRFVQLATESPAVEAPKVDPPADDEPATKTPTEPTTAAESKAESEPSAAEPPRRPPVTITVTEDGRILLASEDTAALDRLEQFIGQAAPQSQRYKIFKIKYADVFDVYLNLKEFYEDEIKGDTKQTYNWYWDEFEDTKSDQGRLLSKRAPLRLIWDPDSNSILVANASARQLAEIQSLIDEYDQPAPEDETAERITQPIKIQYSRASTIVTAVKEVFRDLLSSKDKEFDSKDPNAKGGSGSSGVTILRYSPGGSSSTSTNKQSPVKVGFQGALSLGADDVSNIVLVSAQKEVFEGVVAMIKELDEEAAPKTTLHVHRLTGNIKAEYLQKALDEAVGKAWLGNRPEQTGAQPEQKQDNDQDRDRGNREGRRRNRDND